MSIHIWGPLSIAFALGIGWRLFSRSTKAYRSQLRSYPSRWAFVKNNWDVFLLRTFPFNSGLFALWIFHPGLLSKLAAMAMPENIANWLTVPPTLGSAFGFGFLVDYALDQIQLRLTKMTLPSWLPDALKGEIPCYDQNVVNGTILVQSSNRDTGMGNGKTTTTTNTQTATPAPAPPTKGGN